jgi:type VI secretion system protein ImpK
MNPNHSNHSIAPTLVNTPASKVLARTTDFPSKSLVDLLYDGFYMLILMYNRTSPKDAASFAQGIQKFLDKFEQSAKKRRFNADDIFDAKYAFCAAVDEAVLNTQSGISDLWERRPLQLTLFGDQLAGEHFFDKLETARNGGASRIHALDVFYMCLLTGFKGRYLLEGPEKLKYLTAQLGEQIAHIKGKPPAFAPHWFAPDRFTHAITREIPVWVIGSVLALSGLVAYTGFQWMALNGMNKTLAPYENIIKMAPRIPTLTITLP